VWERRNALTNRQISTELDLFHLETDYHDIELKMHIVVVVMSVVSSKITENGVVVNLASICWVINGLKQ